MGFIGIGYQRDSMGRMCEAFIHTDDFSDEDYSDYCKIKSEYSKALEDKRSGKDDVRIILGLRSLHEISKDYHEFMRYLTQKYGGC